MREFGAILVLTSLNPRKASFSIALLMAVVGNRRTCGSSRRVPEPFHGTHLCKDCFGSDLVPHEKNANLIDFIPA